MRKIKSIGASMAVLAGVLGLAAPAAANAATLAPAANAAALAPAVSSYTTNAIQRCLFGINLCLELQAYATHTYTQIWINGKVSCNDPQHAATVTWCGVGGGNGTATLNIGMNWNWPSIGAYNLYERMNIPANHNNCSTWGTNTNVSGYSWYNGELLCKSPV